MPKKPDTAMMMQAVDNEMTVALMADGGKLKAITGEDHGPFEIMTEKELLAGLDLVVSGKPAPVDVANNAGDAIEASHRSAELLRSQGSLILSIAQTIKTEGDALALNIEHRAERFANMIETFNEYARQAHITFDQERTRLDQFKVPGAQS